MLSGTALIESEAVGATLAAAKSIGDVGIGDIAETYESPTEEEKHVLRRVTGSIPMVSWVLCAAELAERASYYGASQ